MKRGRPARATPRPTPRTIAAYSTAVASAPPPSPWLRGDSYPCPDMHLQAVRPGAGDADRYPSRMGDRLHHRDGRVTDLQGRPVPDAAPDGTALRRRG